MEIHELRAVSARRSFLQAALPGAALLCLGACCQLHASQFQEKAKTSGQKHKFLDDSGMSFAEVFNFAHTSRLPLFRGLERELGSERFVPMLKRIIDENAKL
jgi:hypothetical protein